MNEKSPDHVTLLKPTEDHVIHLSDQQPTLKSSLFTLACLCLSMFTCVFFLFSSSHEVAHKVNQPLFNNADDSPYSAIACMDLTKVPKFKGWSVKDEGDASLEQMAWDVYCTVRDAKDDSTSYLDLQDILAVRVTESNTVEDDTEHVHTAEAIMQIIMDQGNNVPDTACVYGHEDNGHRFAFVYGYDGNKVENTECSVGSDDGYCRFVDTAYYKEFSE